MTGQELIQKIAEDSKENSNIPVVIGAFGDTDYAHGFIEGPVIQPETGGTFMKLYGCNYLCPCFPEQTVVESFGLPKGMISAIPREIVSKSFVLKIALGLIFLFRPRKAIHMAHVYFSVIQANFIAKIPIPEIRYNKVSREIKRAVYETLGNKAPNDLLHRDFSITGYNRELAELVANITEFFCLFLELDSAYRFPLQDVLGEFDKSGLEKSVTDSVKSILDKLEDRWNPPSMKDKVRSVSKILIPILRVSPTLRNWVKEFLMQLDLEKVKLDEADWYFSLERIAYDYKGLSFQERMKIRKAMDEKAGNVRLKFGPKEGGGYQVTPYE